jgi:hypothetical protein
MRPIVFVDTNVVDNRGSAQYFLGGRSDLEKISKRADIGLARVVYDELRRHICQYLTNQTIRTIQRQTDKIFLLFVANVGQ